ncbi:MAG: hypothetical protein JWN81_1928 [Solirubrobacterales bacterium]|nr:hypothetical protein [Solirubrobacterales bacterium]
MSSDASTLPVGDGLLGGGDSRRWRLRRGRGAVARAGIEARVAALALLFVVAGSLLLVVVAANRPSLLSPTTHANFFPHWMAGPLGGLWPGLTANGTSLRWLFTGAILAMYLAYVLALRYSGRLQARWVIAAILAVHAIFLLAPPLALTDVFNYINYGRMEIVHHLNPYTTIPISEPHSDPSFALSNWHELLSPYGPLFTLLTFAVVPLGVAGSFWALKSILALASLGTIYLVWKCARLLGRDPVAAIVLVGLNPIVLVWGLGGDHNDFLTMLLIVFAFYLLLRARGARPAAEGSRQPKPAGQAVSPLTRVRGLLLPLSPAEIVAGAAFATAAATKASAGILMPVVLAGLLRAPRRLTQVVIGMAAAGVVIALVSLIAFGLHIPDLNTQSRLVTNESVPNLIGLMIGAGGENESVRVVISAVLGASVLFCCAMAWRRRDSLGASGWASVALLVTLSWVLPWYVLWVLPLAALAGSRRLRNVALVLGVYLIVAWAPASTLVWNAIGFHPEKTPLGRLHQRYVKELLH